MTSYYYSIISVTFIYKHTCFNARNQLKPIHLFSVLRRHLKLMDTLILWVRAQHIHWSHVRPVSLSHLPVLSCIHLYPVLRTYPVPTGFGICNQLEKKTYIYIRTYFMARMHLKPLSSHHSTCTYPLLPLFMLLRVVVHCCRWCWHCRVMLKFVCITCTDTIKLQHSSAMSQLNFVRGWKHVMLSVCSDMGNIQKRNCQLPARRLPCQQCWRNLAIVVIGFLHVNTVIECEPWSLNIVIPRKCSFIPIIKRAIFSPSDFKFLLYWHFNLPRRNAIHFWHITALI